MLTTSEKYTYNSATKSKKWLFLSVSFRFYQSYLVSTEQTR